MGVLALIPPSKSPGICWFIALCAVVASASLISKWPMLTIDDEGVCFSSRWGDRKVKWREVRSISVGGWGAFRYVKISRATGWAISVPQWFPASADELRNEMEMRWRSR
jgi:hypothetical protein